jgi:hypothetical protein
MKVQPEIEKAQTFDPVAQEQDRLPSTTIFTKLDTPYGRESPSDTCAGSHGIRLEQQTQTSKRKT